MDVAGYYQLEGQNTEFKMPDFCHVYSPEAWHDDAFIVAGTDALLKIKETIDKAIAYGQGSCSLFVGDGEGFDLVIVKLDDSAKQNKMQVPYTDDIASSQHGLSPDSDLIVDYDLLMQDKQLRRANL